MRRIQFLLLALVPVSGFAMAVYPSQKNIKSDWSKRKVFEGDIVLSPGQVVRNGILSTAHRWSNGIVNFAWEGSFATSESLRSDVIKAMDQISRKTCIKFQQVAPTDSSDYVAITNSGLGCFANVGRVGGRQVINLQIPNCNVVSVALHELLHTIGFYHEQSRPDRDKYITINWDNLIAGTEANFETRSNTLTFGLGYDYASILHYHDTAFSKNGRKTILAKRLAFTIGGSDMTWRDYARVNKMYAC